MNFHFSDRYFYCLVITGWRSSPEDWWRAMLFKQQALLRQKLFLLGSLAVGSLLYIVARVGSLDRSVYSFSFDFVFKGHNFVLYTVLPVFCCAFNKFQLNVFFFSALCLFDITVKCGFMPTISGFGKPSREGKMLPQSDGWKIWVRQSDPFRALLSVTNARLDRKGRNVREEFEKNSTSVKLSGFKETISKNTEDKPLYNVERKLRIKCTNERDVTTTLIWRILQNWMKQFHSKRIKIIFLSNSLQFHESVCGTIFNILISLVIQVFIYTENNCLPWRRQSCLPRTIDKLCSSLPNTNEMLLAATFSSSWGINYFISLWIVQTFDQRALKHCLLKELKLYGLSSKIAGEHQPL